MVSWRWVTFSLPLAACSAFGVSETAPSSPGDAGTIVADGSTSDAPMTDSDGDTAEAVMSICAAPDAGLFDDFEGTTPFGDGWSKHVDSPNLLDVDLTHKYCGAQSVLVTLTQPSGKAMISRTLPFEATHLHWAFLFYALTLPEDSTGQIQFAKLQTSNGISYSVGFVGETLEFAETQDAVVNATPMATTFPLNVWTLIDVVLQTSGAFPTASIRVGDPHNPMSLNPVPLLISNPGSVTAETLGVSFGNTQFKANIDRDEIAAE